MAHSATDGFADPNADLVDLVCIVYHEARNVRHPIKSGLVEDRQRFDLLLTLSSNRNDAWRQMSSYRAIARREDTAITPRAIDGTFEQAYGVTVLDLVELYERPIWKHSAHGGNAWARIAREVAKALEWHAAGNHRQRNDAIAAILQMQHNTGSVKSKLHALQTAV